MSSNQRPACVVLNRRTLLRLLATSAIVVGGGGAGLLAQSCVTPAQLGQPTPAPTQPNGADLADFAPDVEIQLTARPATVQILPGAPTAIWRYDGTVLKGEANVVLNLPDSYLGPILQLHKGQKVRIRLQNELPEATIIHWHGLIVPPAMDGHPSTAVEPGQSYVYEFTVRNRAGTYWFHPHAHGTTGAQVIKGLAGLFIVHDEEEAQLALPGGEFDLPLILQDRAFDPSNQFVYDGAAMAEMGDMGGMNMTTMMGFLGETLLVNGQPNATLSVAARSYRLRLLNGSNARIYKLAWSNGAPLTVIATDGGLLTAPVQRDYVTLAPGERVELWADFSQTQPGTEIKLRSLEYTGVEAGMMMGGMMMQMESAGALPNGATFDLLTVHVERPAVETLTLPAQLTTGERYALSNAVNAANPRRFELTMQNMQWLINGKAFELTAVDASETVQFDTLEVWEFVNQQGVGAQGNRSSGMSGMHHNHQGASTGNLGMQEVMNDFMAHPMHIHGVQFQVIERQIDPAYASAWATVSAGFVDEGWKDTVLVMPGEQVKILLRFNEYAGRYLLHCHNLEHESTGMMRNFLIV